ncbi:MAG: 2-oxoglutarate dehydrogenase, E2 component, dihydrolipoamide succinyltransferase [Nitriliruptorales bacterium]|nr:2-oxoglutarate dehydrogenase, E2 component, dihydrolipoamide succinyltransferase [Nitriliruptorales bacterium]
MADSSRRRRRGGPADGGSPEGGTRRRRRRGGPPSPEPRRRRRGGGTDDQATAPQEGSGSPSGAPSAQETPSRRSTNVATEVTLPQLGESVTEGTITAWLVDVGDTVNADQPLFELSSDKIDTEVPAPASGVLTEIRVQVDETVDVGTVVAVIGGEEEATGDGRAPDTATEEQQAPAEQAEAEAEGGDAEAAAPVTERERVAGEEPEERPEPATATPEHAEGVSAEGDGGNGRTEGVLASPIVRRMVAEHDLDLSSITPSGEGGRVTREDVEAVIVARAPGEAEPETRAERAPQPERRAPVPSGERERTEDLSRIRRRIAAKMMESMQSSAQLTTVQEADMTGIMRLREQVKDGFKAREGVSLSPFAFLCRAAVITVRRPEFQMVNAQADWETGRVTFHDYVNLGIAVDTERGLMVPNIKSADDLTLPALARAINEVANKARGKGKLEMQDIEGGTFTLTNTGSRGVLIDTPILNHPEVAILGTGAIQKRPVVTSDETGDSISIRDMVYLCLTYDHQLLDGADAARFVTDVAQVVEDHDWAQEIGY